MMPRFVFAPAQKVAGRRKSGRRNGTGTAGTGRTHPLRFPARPFYGWKTPCRAPTRRSIRQDMRASLQHDGKGPPLRNKGFVSRFLRKALRQVPQHIHGSAPPLSQIFRPKTQARKTPVQTGQNALPGPRDVPLRGRASAMHAGFRGKRPTKPFPETQRCPFPGQPAETSMMKHPEGAGTGHRFLAPGCAQAEARPPPQGETRAYAGTDVLPEKAVRIVRKNPPPAGRRGKLRPAGVPPEKTRAGSFGRYPCREGVRTAGM